MSKTCLVTGAAAGIGRETALGLLKTGATVIAVVRDATRGKACVDALRADSGNPNVQLLVCDLASQQSIRAAVAEVKQKHATLDVLVNQAGVYTATRKVTPDGLELMFAVNHLAYHALTVPLVPLLKAAGKARVVNGTGALEAAGTIDFDDLQAEKKFSPFKALTQSKLGNVLFTLELARRLAGTGVTATCFHPGGVKTRFGAGEGGVLGAIMGLSRMFGGSAAEAARIPVALALDPKFEGATGYFNKQTPAQPSARARDEALARQLWGVNEALTGARWPAAS